MSKQACAGVFVRRVFRCKTCFRVFQSAQGTLLCVFELCQSLFLVLCVAAFLLEVCFVLLHWSVFGSFFALCVVLGFVLELR